jgi:hypothetical protein
MRQLSVNVVSFDELSKESKKIAKENIQDFLFDVLSFHVKDIKESKDAYLNAYHSGKLFHLNKDDCPLTGVCYDYDFMEIDHINSDSVENDANKVFMKLKKDEKKNVFNDEYVADLCEGNEIYFLENGAEYCKIEYLLKGLI